MVVCYGDHMQFYQQEHIKFDGNGPNLGYGTYSVKANSGQTTLMSERTHQTEFILTLNQKYSNIEFYMKNNSSTTMTVGSVGITQTN